MDPITKELMLNNTLLRVLEHFRLAKVDYAKNITRYTEIQRNVVMDCLKTLENNGLIEKFTNTSIKRTEAKLKRSAEVHKHHTYFQLTKYGTGILKGIDISSYLDLLGEECISMLKRKRERQMSRQKAERMAKMGLLDKHLDLTHLGKEILKSLPKSS